MVLSLDHKTPVVIFSLNDQFSKLELVFQRCKSEQEILWLSAKSIEVPLSGRDSEIRVRFLGEISLKSSALSISPLQFETHCGRFIQ